jgi:hypothetical protein
LNADDQRHLPRQAVRTVTGLFQTIGFEDGDRNSQLAAAGDSVRVGGAIPQSMPIVAVRTLSAAKPTGIAREPALAWQRKGHFESATLQGALRAATITRRAMATRAEMARPMPCRPNRGQHSATRKGSNPLSSASECPDHGRARQCAPGLCRRGNHVDVAAIWQNRTALRNIFDGR